MTKNQRKNRRRPIPLAPSLAIKSRKKARQVTTLFHKYTRERDLAQQGGNLQKVQECNEQLEKMGGRAAYQRASQLSTSHHSTSKWVLGVLFRKGWLYGILQDEKQRRTTRLLEVGAINTELIDAAAAAHDSKHSGRNYNLSVRAIDLHSMHDSIEQADFLTLPKSKDPYDVCVCSMVLNSVTTPQQRGCMLLKIYEFLRPGGLLFLTLPRLCLTQSPYLTPTRFVQLLTKGVGFQLEESKQSPKVAFYVLQRPNKKSQPVIADKQWNKLTRINHGKKFRNEFGIILDDFNNDGRTDEA